MPLAVPVPVYGASGCQVEPPSQAQMMAKCALFKLLRRRRIGLGLVQGSRFKQAKSTTSKIVHHWCSRSYPTTEVSSPGGSQARFHNQGAQGGSARVVSKCQSRAMIIGLPPCSRHRPISIRRAQVVQRQQRTYSPSSRDREDGVAAAVDNLNSQSPPPAPI